MDFSKAFRCGSIPACAGEPGAVPCRIAKRGVYPRVCGGTTFASATATANQGLSPRVRGNHLCICHRYREPGSIPACAGEPANSDVDAGLPRVYPRVCGGTTIATGIVLAIGGLSPRVRGNPPAHFELMPLRGSIPACAGEPTTATILPSVSWVYPRVCGGTTKENPKLEYILGLSPRVRGNPSYGAHNATCDGSIPACAGEPGVIISWASRLRVYPRVCGGTGLARYAVGMVSGLSPRVRGNHAGRRSGAGRRRSIPACAGEPRCRRAQSPQKGVYPRVCGGTAVIYDMVRSAAGLSPRVRGNLG